MSSLSSSGDVTTLFVLQQLIVVFSNIFFVGPAVLSWKLGKPELTFVYISILITSSLYHACIFGPTGENVSSGTGVCVLIEYNAYYLLDHLFASLSLVVLGLHLTLLDSNIFIFKDANGNVNDITSMERIKKRWYGAEVVSICVYSYVIGIGLLKLGAPDAFLLCVGASVSISVITLAVYFYVVYGVVVRYEIKRFILGIILATISCVLIFSQSLISSEYFWIVHATWHYTAAWSHYVLLSSKRRCYVVSLDKSIVFAYR